MTEVPGFQVDVYIDSLRLWFIYAKPGEEIPSFNQRVDALRLAKRVGKIFGTRCRVRNGTHIHGFVEKNGKIVDAHGNYEDCNCADCFDQRRLINRAFLSLIV